MKVVQINKVNPSVTVDGAKTGSITDVSACGPLSIVVQLTLSASSTPSGITAYLQGSIDGNTFFDTGVIMNLTVNGVFRLVATSVEYTHYRVRYAHSSGSIVSTERVMVYGDR